MLTSEELVHDVAQRYPLQRLAAINDHVHQTAIWQRTSELFDHPNRRLGQWMLGIDSILSVMSVAAGLVFHNIDITLASLLTSWIAVALPGFWYEQSVLKPRCHRQAQAEIAQPPVTVSITTRLVTSNDVHRLITGVTVGDDTTTVEDIVIDPGDEQALALAARMQARNEQALPQLHTWTANPTSIRPTQSITPRQDVDVINRLLTTVSSEDTAQLNRSA